MKDIFHKGKKKCQGTAGSSLPENKSLQTNFGEENSTLPDKW